MKAFITCIIITICMVLTMACIFTLDSHSVKTSEIQQIADIEMSSLAKEFFDGTISAFDLDSELANRVNAVSGSRSQTVASVAYANYDMKVVSFVVSLTYKQANGSTRTLSRTRTFILERPEIGHSYQYIRSIRKDYYNLSSDQGGLCSDSIWRTSDYLTTLETVLGV